MLWTLLLLCGARPLVAQEPARARGAGALYRGPVGADLALVQRAWEMGGRVSVLPPRMAVRGSSLGVALPAEALAADTPECATLLALSAPNAVFSLSFAERGAEARRDFPLSSSRGLIELTRCGPRKAALAGISIDAASPRVVISFLLALGEAPARASASLLPDRQPGATADAPRLGPRPMLAEGGDRTAHKRRLRTLGRPQEMVDVPIQADAAGNAQAALTLAAGCHTVDVFDVSPQAGAPDIDARLLTVDGETLAVDTSVSPDAALTACLGQANAVTLDVRGLSAEGPGAFLRSSWPLPDGLPVEWGPRARGRLAEALFGQQHGQLSARPITASLGVQGNTRVVAAATPGACYVAVVAALDRTPERLGLALRAGGRTHQSRSRAGRTSALAMACATAPLLAIEVQSVGAGASWILGVWAVEGETAP